MNKLRLGSICFINSLPVDHALASGLVDAPCRVTRAVPSQLNAMISAGELDLSPVSSLHYAEHASDLVLVPDVSISSKSGVKSVLLFSTVPVQALEGKKIGMSSMAKTTPALLKVLLGKRYGVRAEYVPGNFDGHSLKTSGFDALLLIGDEALAASSKNTGNLFVYDLAVEWTQWTGLPFVFAVWVVRKAFFREQPGLVQKTIAGLRKSKEWGMEHPESVVRAARRQTGLDAEILRDYFRKLRYDFGPDLKEGFTRYAGLARELGLIGETPIEEELADVGQKS